MVLSVKSGSLKVKARLMLATSSGLFVACLSRSIGTDPVTTSEATVDGIFIYPSACVLQPHQVFPCVLAIVFPRIGSIASGFLTSFFIPPNSWNLLRLLGFNTVNYTLCTIKCQVIFHYVQLFF